MGERHAYSAADAREDARRQPTPEGEDERRVRERELWREDELPDWEAMRDHALATRRSVSEDRKQVENLYRKVPVEDALAHLAVALMSLEHARDFHARAGCYPEGTVADHQCFDDWAADVASKALDHVYTTTKESA